MHAMSPEMQLSLYPLFFCEDRHESAEVCREGAGVSRAEHAAEVSRWRMKERMKTTSVALVMCLNIGVDPPDVLKISPCARMECWINPLAMQPAKALEAIGKALQAQYERWQPRAKYKTQLDPTVEDVKKLCQSCRRNAKNERVLLHYNGHGVPRPTSNGEIWVFNKSYTQYIPLSVYDLQSWTGNPAIYVFDCGGAGVLVDAFLQLAQRGGLAKPTPQTAANPSPNGAASDQAPRVAGDGASAPGVNAPGAGGGVERSGVERLPGDAAGRDALGVAAVASRADATLGGAMPLGAGMSEVILLAACGADETLPQSAELPADVFSACLTTPIKIALRWFCSRSVLRRDGVDASLIDKIPGQQNNRKTPLGELNWIFTAVTDTIAWNALPRPLFQRLFRQDLLVASLFRNFLLAERVMRASNCAPVSCPAMPPTYQHPMWHAWDAAVETCLLQMPGLLNGDDGSGGGNGAAVEFAPSPFFTEQLTAFEVWLERGSAKKPPPEQLPIVLQVLLSQSHRLRALVLLGRFLDMGPWAVDLALSVGIFPYVLKLLQTTAPDLRQILVFIWTKILALDASCQADLVKDGGHAYFARFLDAPDTPSEERAMAAFVLSAVCDGHPKGQAACAASGVARICLERLAHAASVGPSGSPLLVRWLCLCLGKLWENARDAQTEAFACGAPEAVASLLGHPTPDARAAAVYALGALVYVPEEGESCVDEDETETETSSFVSNARGGPSSTADVPGTTARERGDPTRHEAREQNVHASETEPENKKSDRTFGALERAAAERAVACQILPGVTDASPSVRAETAVALGRLACAHARSFQAAAEAFAKPDPTSLASDPTAGGAPPRKPASRRSSRDLGRRGGSMGALDEEAISDASPTLVAAVAFVSRARARLVRFGERAPHGRVRVERVAGERGVRRESQRALRVAGAQRRGVRRVRARTVRARVFVLAGVPRPERGRRRGRTDRRGRAERRRERRSFVRRNLRSSSSSFDGWRFDGRNGHAGSRSGDAVDVNRRVVRRRTNHASRRDGGQDVRERGRRARGRRSVQAPARASGGAGARPVASRRGGGAEGAAGHRPGPRPRAAAFGGGARGASRRGRNRPGFGVGGGRRARRARRRRARVVRGSV